MQEMIKVLLIEDNPGDKRLIQHTLLDVKPDQAPAPYTFVWHATLAAGLDWVLNHPVDIVLLDLSLSDSHGLATVQCMLAAAPTLPIIVLTGLNDELLAVQLLREGAQDYLVKDTITGVLLRRSIRYARERKQMTDTLHQMNSALEERVRERTAQLEHAVAELERASELKDEFLAMVSHEMRTPLTGILGMADALELQLAGELNERQLRYVDTIRGGGQRLLTMVNSILRYTSLISGKVKLSATPCELANLCAGILRTIQPLAAQKQQTIAFTIEPPQVEIVSNADGIRQLLENLLDNAVKFTPAGGQIGLAVRVAVDRDEVEFVVWDTGIGIPAEQHERMFQPFIQVDSSLARHYEGIGLGLAYVQRVVSLLGGKITVQSTPDQGSRFTVTLPRVAANLTA